MIESVTKTRLTFSISAAIVFAGCGGSMSPSAPVTSAASSAAQRPLRGASAPDAFRRGIYVSTFTAIYGFRINPRHNHPTCMVKAAYPGAVAVDALGNLMVPNGGSKSVTIFKGPKMCGPELGSFDDPYGQPSDAASSNAVTGTIAVANIFDTSGPGSISICTFSSGCTKNLTNSNMYEVVGVALATNGDCWASATNSVGTATLTYFKGCSGSGQAATGLKNTYYGGLAIDSHANLVAADAFVPQLWVYKGCNPKCSLVGGPFALKGDSVFVSLNKNSTQLAAGDYSNGEVDVYAYTPTSLTYEYSFGVGGSSDVEGVAYNPRSKE
jgi:hypothetical protein